MATNRKRTPRSRKAIGPLTPALLHYFKYGLDDICKTLEGYKDALGLAIFDDGVPMLRVIWREHGADIVAAWQKENPGTLPAYVVRYGPKGK
jgi:hypothetical protein